MSDVTQSGAIPSRLGQVARRHAHPPNTEASSQATSWFRVAQTALARCQTDWRDDNQEAPLQVAPREFCCSPSRPYSSTYDDDVRVSTRGDYACRALLSLAIHAETACPTSVRDIAERTALPQPYLEQILLALKGAGLVKSKRGVGGGYILARPTSEIRLSDIISAVDGPITLGDFGAPHQNGACDHDGQCVLLAIWDLAGRHMREHLGAYTLADIASVANGDKAWPDADLPHSH